MLADLVTKYGVQAPAEQLSSATLDLLAARIGARLAEGKSGAVPAQDLAALALLLASAGEAAPPARPADQRAPARPAGPVASSDLEKGQEGFRQGIEKLRQLPASERIVITGDVTAGMQAATVPGGPDLTSMFGRARINAIARAIPGSADGLISEGHFFVQMQAAGGPFDSRALGGPEAFTAFNDVATRRSRFNEGLSRGNLYLSKAFYQQEVRLGEGRALGRAGIIDLSDFFDTNVFANNESRQFLNSSLVNSAGYKAGLVAPGIMAEYRRSIAFENFEAFALRAGYAVSRTERAFTSPVWTSEIEFRRLTRGYHGNWRFGGTAGNVAGAGSFHGVHFSGDQWLSRRVGAFGRAAFSSSGPGARSLSPVRRSWGGGLQWRFSDDEERTSALAVGFSRASPADPQADLAAENVFETYYRWQVTENLALTPDFQIVAGAGGRRNRSTQAVLGIRMFFGF